VTRLMDTKRRFQILQRDNFECQFCGSRPGNDQLNVAHMFPHSRGGTEHDNNLTTACVRCNNGMGVLVSVPAKFCTTESDRSGWRIWKRWGKWILSWNPEGRIEDPKDHPDWPFIDGTADIALTFEPLDYWIALERVHEQDWHEHLGMKPWMRTRSDRGLPSRPAPARRGFIDAADLLNMSEEQLREREEQEYVDRHYDPKNWPNYLEAMAFARSLVDPAFKKRRRQR
jgi:5-methylcytosine-specific restriction protein A